MNSKEM